MAKVHEWADDIAKVYFESGYNAALKRRNEIEDAHKMTLADSVVLNDELRKRIKPKVKVI